MKATAGPGASYREAAVVAEETGKAAAFVPYLTSAVMATAALLGTGDAELLAGPGVRAADRRAGRRVRHHAARPR